jgi:hypothetical protein
LVVAVRLDQPGKVSGAIGHIDGIYECELFGPDTIS